MTRPAVLPVQIPADTLVIAAVPTSVQEVQRTTAVLMLPRPNAERLVVIVKTALPEAAIIQVLMPDLRNAEAVITAPIPAVPDRSLFLALQIIIKCAFLQPNAEQAVIPANIIRIAPLQTGIVITDAPIRTPAESALPASPSRLSLQLRQTRGLM